MNNGKYSTKKNRKRRLIWSKQFVLLCAVVMLLIGVIGGSLAFLTTNSNAVENTFTPGKVSCTINEPKWTDGDIVKSNVTVTNTGNTDAYIRAAIVVTWVDASGNKAPQVPVPDTDYTLDIGDDWRTFNDGYYYYNATVAPSGTTTNLIDSCKVIKGNLDGYTLCVEILADAIQSTGTSANGTPVAQSWGHTPSAN